MIILTANLSLLDQAIILATRAHAGQIDKGGAPYILHPLRVMLGCQTEEQRIAAVLHDTYEDGGITIEYIEEHFRSEEHTSELQSLMRISYAVFCLKKKKRKHKQIK